MQKLFYAPGACSLGIHVILEEIGKPYDAEVLKIREGAQFAADFAALNPKAKVPTLVRDDGTVLTEFPAIAWWLAASNPEAGLLPAGADAQARALEAMDFAVSTVHMHGFSRMFRPDKYSTDAAQHDDVKAQGRKMVDAGLAVLDRGLGSHDYVAGSYSVADAAVFYIEFWAAGRMGIPLPANLAAHYARMKARPAVARVMEKEGIAG